MKELVQHKHSCSMSVEYHLNRAEDARKEETVRLSRANGQITALRARALSAEAERDAMAKALESALSRCEECGGSEDRGTFTDEDGCVQSLGACFDCRNDRRAIAVKGGS